MKFSLIFVTLAYWHFMKGGGGAYQQCNILLQAVLGITCLYAK